MTHRVRFERPARFSAEQQRLALRLLAQRRWVGEMARTFAAHPASV